jgi:hypothetical protein
VNVETADHPRHFLLLCRSVTLRRCSKITSFKTSLFFAAYDDQESIRSRHALGDRTLISCVSAIETLLVPELTLLFWCFTSVVGFVKDVHVAEHLSGFGDTPMCSSKSRLGSPLVQYHLLHLQRTPHHVLSCSRGHLHLWRLLRHLLDQAAQSPTWPMLF